MSDQTKNEEWARDCSDELVIGSDNLALAEDDLRLWELLRNEPPEPSMEQMRDEWERDNKDGDDDDEQ